MYNIPRICVALVRAADRGCSINVVVETPTAWKLRTPTILWRRWDRPYHPDAAFIFGRWRNGKRTRRVSLGFCTLSAVADGRWLFLSSANLTEYAFTLNMELGLLNTGGDLPGQIEQHFNLNDSDRSVGKAVRATTAMQGGATLRHNSIESDDNDQHPLRGSNLFTMSRLI